MDIVDNIVPYISGEEEKSEKEPLKILGKIQKDKIVNDDSIKISAPFLIVQTNRIVTSVEIEGSRREIGRLLIGFNIKWLSSPLSLAADRDDGIVEGRVYVRRTGGDVLTFLLARLGGGFFFVVFFLLFSHFYPTNLLITSW